MQWNNKRCKTLKSAVIFFVLCHNNTWKSKCLTLVCSDFPSSVITSHLHSAPLVSGQNLRTWSIQDAVAFMLMLLWCLSRRPPLHLKARPLPSLSHPPRSLRAYTSASIDSSGGDRWSGTGCGEGRPPNAPDASSLDTCIHVGVDKGAAALVGDESFTAWT